MDVEDDTEGSEKHAASSIRNNLENGSNMSLQNIRICLKEITR
jgi:hypothetical protein